MWIKRFRLLIVSEKDVCKFHFFGVMYQKISCVNVLDTWCILKFVRSKIPIFKSIRIFDTLKQRPYDIDPTIGIWLPKHRLSLLLIRGLWLIV